MKKFQKFLLTTALSIMVLIVFAAQQGLSRGEGSLDAPVSTVANGDVNGDGKTDISDPIYLLAFLFRGGPQPVACAASSPCESSTCSVRTVYGAAESLQSYPVPPAGTMLSVSVLGRDAAGDGGGGIFYWDAASQAADDGVFSNCFTYNNSPHGYRMSINGPVKGAFSIFALQNCSSESDTVGCRIDGSGTGGGLRARIETSEFQDSSVSGIEVNEASVSIVDTHIEGRGVSLQATKGARVYLENTSAPIDSPTSMADSTSTVLVTGSHVNSLGPLNTRARLGVLADNLGWTADLWGPPNLSPGARGAAYPKGFAYTDHMGVEWVCTTPGTSGEAAFIARHGRILRPIGVSDLVNGTLLWFPHEDMVITRVSLVKTQTFEPIPPTYDLTITTLKDGNGDDLIGVAGPDLSLLAEGNVLVSTTNQKPYARLTPAGKEMSMKGSPPNVSPPAGHRISLFTHPSRANAWKAGAGYLVIEGYYLKYD